MMPVLFSLFGSDPHVRAAVLTGSGTKAFCAGGDIADFRAQQDALAVHVKHMTACLHMAVSRFAWIDAPLIAAVNGVVAGAALGMVALCVIGGRCRTTGSLVRRHACRTASRLLDLVGPRGGRGL